MWAVRLVFCDRKLYERCHRRDTMARMPFSINWNNKVKCSSHRNDCRFHEKTVRIRWTKPCGKWKWKSWFQHLLSSIKMKQLIYIYSVREKQRKTLIFRYSLESIAMKFHQQTIFVAEKIHEIASRVHLKIKKSCRVARMKQNKSSICSDFIECI